MKVPLGKLGLSIHTLVGEEGELVVDPTFHW